MNTVASFFPFVFLLIYIFIPVGIIVVIYYFYQLAKIRNQELKKQNEILERIASVLERSS